MRRLLIHYFVWVSRFFFYQTIALIAAFGLEIINSGSLLLIIGVAMVVGISCTLCAIADDLTSQTGEE